MSSIQRAQGAARKTIRAGAVGLLAIAGIAFGATSASAMSLEAAVRAAVTTNPTARAADQAMRAAAMELLELERDFRPRLTLYAEAGLAYYDDPDRLAPDEQRETSQYDEVGVVAEYTLFDGYRRANTVYRNAARLDGAILRVLDASETMALSAVEAYIDVVRHRDLISVARESIARHRALAGQVDDLVAAGRLPASAGFEAEERLLAARLSEIEVRQALRDADAGFRAVVGTDPGTPMNVPRAPDSASDREDFIIASVRGSFRLADQERAVAERRFETGVVGADTLPQVTLEGGLRRADSVAGTDGVDADGFVGLRLDWEFYAGGREARNRALEFRTREAQARHDATRREVIALAERSWNNALAAIERAFLLHQRREVAQRTADEYLAEFEAGTRSLIEVLDAERNRFNITFEAISARASHTFAQYRLLAAQSRLAEHFGIAAADMELAPDFVDKATRAPRPQGIFRTEIRALE